MPSPTHLLLVEDDFRLRHDLERHLLQRGFAVIPSSTKRENLASNLLAQKLQLTDSEMALMAALERNGREVNPEGLAPLWD